MIKSAIAWSLVGALAFAAGGCRKFGKSLALPAKPTVPYIYSLDDYKKDFGIYTDNAGKTNDNAKEQAKQARNNIAWGLMGMIDELYNEYAANLYSGKGAIAVSGDAATLGLTAGAAIAKQVATKTIFGALGTAVTGMALSVDKNAFAQQTYQVIALAMETRRTVIYTEISDGLSKKSVVDYPLPAVKRDLVLYLYAGSLPGGLQEIQKEAGAASAKTDSQIKPAGAPVVK